MGALPADARAGPPGSLTRPARPRAGPGSRPSRPTRSGPPPGRRRSGAAGRAGSGSMITGATSGRNAVTGASRIAATSRRSGTNAGRRAATATIGSTRKLLGGIHSASRRPITSTPSALGRRARPPPRPRAGPSRSRRRHRVDLAARKRDLARVVAAVVDALGEHEHRLPVGTGVDEDEGGREPGAGWRRRPLERDAVGEPLRAQPGRRRWERVRRRAHARADLVGRHGRHRRAARCATARAGKGGRGCRTRPNAAAAHLPGETRVSPGKSCPGARI